MRRDDDKSMAHSKDQERALELIGEAMKHQMARGIRRRDSACIENPSRSILPPMRIRIWVGPIALSGDSNEAIAQCEIAIQLDPEFGNPYNDIGVYFMQQQQFDDAIAWFERAKSAKRYEPRHFPYINLGRIYLNQRNDSKGAGRVRQRAQDQSGRQRTFATCRRMAHEAPVTISFRRSVDRVRAQTR